MSEKSKILSFSGMMNYIKRGSSFNIIFIILCLYFLGFTPNLNEENYLQLAKAYMNPDWIPNSFLLTEQPGTRILYQIIVGSFLDYFSFEITTFIFRLLLIVAFSFIISRIYKELKISNKTIIFHLGFLFLAHQSLFAGSWLLISVEAKGFAYFFILTSIYFGLKRRFMLFVIAGIIATYFHVLVGLQSFFLLSITFLFIENRSKKNILKWVKLFLIYGISVLPFIIYLKSSLQSPNLEPNADWIYTYFRNPHHTALFKSSSFFVRNHLKGIIISLLGLLFTILVYKESRKIDNNRFIFAFCIISLSFVLFLVPLAYFDTSGFLLKYYPYRINSLSTFFLTLIFSQWLLNSVKDVSESLIYFVTLSAALITSFNPILINITGVFNSFKESPVVGVANYLKEKTEKSSVLLVLEDNPRNSEFLSLTRKSERDRFVEYKFVPADLNKIHEWYDRVLQKEKIIKDLDHLPNVLKNYKIDYVLSRTPLEEKGLKIEYSDQSFFLYFIIPKN